VVQIILGALLVAGIAYRVVHVMRAARVGPNEGEPKGGIVGGAVLTALGVLALVGVREDAFGIFVATGLAIFGAWVLLEALLARRLS
jgi:hypothetical protein